MEFASKYVYLNQNESKEKEFFKKKKLNSKQVKEESKSSSSSDDGDDKRAIRKADTNIVAINLGTLADSALNMFTGDPLFCKNCTCVFNSLSALSNTNDEENEQFWMCEFCDNRNVVILDQEEIPKTDTIDYLLIPPQNNTNSDTEIIVFCIDTSGSMLCTSEISGKLKVKKNKDLESYRQFIDDNSRQYLPREKKNVTYISRLQCVQAALDTHIDNFARNFPLKKVIIVDFNTEVTIHKENNEKIKIVGDKLTNIEFLKSVGKEIDLEQIRPVVENRDDLCSTITNLSENGQTALGPALLASLSIASLKPGSSVVLCTDGLANVGVGSLENLELESEILEKFYNDVADTAKTNGVTINVISIEGTNVNLEYIGKVAQTTNGYNDIVNPLNLNHNLNFLLDNPIIATDVTLKMFLHKGLKWVNEENPINDISCLKNVGNANKESNVSLEFTKSDIEIEGVQKFPFQVQIHYTKLDGSKCIRVISKHQDYTTVREEAEQNINVGVVGLHSVRETAKLAEEGNYSKAKMKTLTHQNMVRRAFKTKKNVSDKEKKQYKNIVGEYAKLETVINDAQNNETDGYNSESDDDSDDGNMDKDKREAKTQNKNTRLKSRKMNRTKNDKMSNVLYQKMNQNYSDFN